MLMGGNDFLNVTFIFPDQITQTRLASHEWTETGTDYTNIIIATE